MPRQSHSFVDPANQVSYPGPAGPLLVCSTCGREEAPRHRSFYSQPCAWPLHCGCKGTMVLRGVPGTSAPARRRADSFELVPA